MVVALAALLYGDAWRGDHNARARSRCAAASGAGRGSAKADHVGVLTSLNGARHPRDCSASVDMARPNLHGLTDAHLEAILAHEVWHVRRRDNLAAAMHMVVEAIFWFHPVAWWLGARLLEERERACDEEVLRLGNPPQVYAESILKTCEFCVGSLPISVSGVTGADLKSRIVRIMTERVTRELDFSKKLLFVGAGLLTIAAPIVFGLQNATPRPAPPAANNGRQYSCVRCCFDQTKQIRRQYGQDDVHDPTG